LRIDPQGRVRINKAGSIVKHAKINVGASEMELTAGLANRRWLIIKPLRSTTTAPFKWIGIGPAGFAVADGTPVWEQYELVLAVGPDVAVYAKRGHSDFDTVDVRVLEIGED
jgi:hypothetical protein